MLLIAIEFGTGYHIRERGCFFMNRNSKGQFDKGNGFKDLTGKKFGRLFVEGLSDKKAGRKAYWWCKCECGKKKEIRSDSLTRTTKPVRSCGCIRDEQATINVKVNHKHKGSYTALHHTWMRMRQRCNNPDNKRYENYGGRGIKVCDDWDSDFETFRTWAQNNGYHEGLSIERINVDGNYEPTNCTWIPMEEQAVNRTSTVWVEFQGETLNLKQWAEKLNINYGTLAARYRRSGMRPPELFEPVKKKIPR